MPTKIFIWDELSDNVMFETDENNNVQVAYTHRPEKFGEVLYPKGARATLTIITTGLVQPTN